MIKICDYILIGPQIALLCKNMKFPVFSKDMFSITYLIEDEDYHCGQQLYLNVYDDPSHVTCASLSYTGRDDNTINDLCIIDDQIYYQFKNDENTCTYASELIGKYLFNYVKTSTVLSLDLSENAIGKLFLLLDK
jgi:hypothetical protein